MTPAAMLVYFGTALLYAALAAGALWAALALGARLAGRPVPEALPRRAVLPAFAALLLVALALHPLPEAATMACPQPNTAPQLRPLAFAARIADLVGHGLPPGALLRDLTVSSSIMNLVVCAGIGVALARAGMRPLAATAAGLALSLTVETAQLTALFGLFPCPYRQFDVDDLILNTAGTALGAVLVHARRRRPPA